MTGLRQLNAALATVLIAFGIWGYAHLPARIPTHFGPNGQPNGWGDRSMFIWLPVIGLVMLLVLIVAAHYSVRNPSLVNMPNKRQFMALPDAEQRRVLEPMVAMMDWLGTLMLLLFLVIEYAMYRSALGGDVSVLLNRSLIVLVVAMIALPLWLLVRMQKELSAAVERQRTGQAVGRMSM